ncbi:DUF6443 domain-containing protein [Flavobacterium pedocola]
MKLKFLFLLSLIFNFAFSQVSPSRNYVYVKTYKEAVNEVTGSTNSNDFNEAVTYLDGTGRKIQTIFMKSGGNNEDLIFKNEYDNLNRQSKKYLPYAVTSNNGAYVTNFNNEQSLFYDVPKYDNTDNPFTEVIFDNDRLYSSREIAHVGNDWSLNNGHTIKSNRSIYNHDNIVDVVYKYNVSYDSNNNPVLICEGVCQPKTLIKYVSKNENWETTDGENNTYAAFKDLAGRTVLKREFENGVAHDTYYVYDFQGNIVFVLSPKVVHANLFDSNNNPVSTYQNVLDNLCYQYRYDYKNRLIEKKLPGSGWQYLVYDTLDRLLLTQDSKQSQLSAKEWNFVEYDIYGRIVFAGTLTDVNNSTREVMQNTVDQLLSSYVYYTGSGDFLFSHYLDQFTLTVNKVSYYDNYQFDLSGITIPTQNFYNENLTTLTNGLLTGTKVKNLSTSSWETSVFFYDKNEKVVKLYDKNETLNTLDVIDLKLDFSGNIIESRTVHNKTGVTTDLVTFDKYSYDKKGRLLKHLQSLGNKSDELILANKYDELGKLVEKKVGGTTLLNLTAITDDQGLLTKSIATDSWTNSSFTTISSVIADGNLKFKATNNSHLAIGLSYSPNTTAYNQINYSFVLTNASHVNGGKTVEIFENGSSKLITNYYAGDLFIIERIGNTIFYKKNGILIYTSTTPTSSATLYGDGHLYAINSSMTNLSIDNYGFTNLISLQTINCKYNIRGWLTQINDPNNLGNDLFALEIRRNNPTSTGTPLYNKNVSQVFWKTANDNQLRYYDYTYDDLNRIKKAKFYNLNNSLQNNSFNLETVNYDKNGNITFMHRAGDKISDPNLEWMDYMSYSYNGNQLTRVQDLGHNYFGHTSQIPTSDSTSQYTYDSNGNMIKDRNKKIANITYNRLNLPEIISFEDISKKIEYVYDSNGKKLSKKVTDGSNVTITEYCGGYIYQKTNANNLVLQYVSQPEGYIANNNNQLNYVYNYKDHLGSTRLSYTDVNKNGIIATSEIIQENNYDPFGLKHTGYNNVYNAFGSIAFKLGYEGQETQDELGLNWIQFKWRNYDSALGRFMSVDPLAEKYNFMTPYQFSSNQPIHAPELEGMESGDGIHHDLDIPAVDQERDFDFFYFEYEGGYMYGFIDFEGNEHFFSFEFENVVEAPESLTEVLEEEVIEPIEDFSDDIVDEPDFGDFEEEEDFDFSDFFTDIFEEVEDDFSDFWNNPFSRLMVADKYSIGVDQSITAVLGVGSGLSLNFITRGHDASFVPYVTHTVGGQIGSDISANAGISLSRGTYATMDMRDLKPGEAANALNGWSFEVRGEAHEGVGGELFMNVGLDDLETASPNWINFGFGFGVGIGGGATLGMQHSVPVNP